MRLFLHLGLVAWASTQLICGLFPLLQKREACGRVFQGREWYHGKTFVGSSEKVKRCELTEMLGSLRVVCSVRNLQPDVLHMYASAVV